jgi:hypothetical protein
MRYYEDENDYPFDYESAIDSTHFDDLVEEEDYEDDVYDMEDEGDEWIDSYNNVEDEIVDE